MFPKPFVGVATPQANPTVEIETRVLLDQYAIPLATRLTSRGSTPAERLAAAPPSPPHPSPHPRLSTQKYRKEDFKVIY